MKHFLRLPHPLKKSGTPGTKISLRRWTLSLLPSFTSAPTQKQNRGNFTAKFRLVALVILLSIVRGANAQVLINEVGMAPIGGANNSFIELFNNTSCLQDVGCDVIVFSGKNSTGDAQAWTVVIPAGTSVASGGYFLIGGTGLSVIGSTTWSNSALGGNTWSNSYGANGKSNADLSIAATGNAAFNGAQPGSFADIVAGQVSILTPAGSLVASASFNAGNNATTYPAMSNALAGCSSLNNINSPANATHDITATFSESGVNGFYLDASGNYQAENSLTPGLSNTLNGGSQASADQPISITTISSTSSVCVGDNLSFSVVASGGNGTLAYSWSGPEGFTSGIANPGVANATEEATGTYTATITDGAGCKQFATTSVAVNALPTVSISGSSLVCGGSNTTLLINATTGSGTIASYQWNKNGSAIVGANTPTYSAIDGGDYTVTVENSNGCSATSSIFTLTEAPQPTVSCPADFVVCFDAAPFALSGSSPVGGIYTGDGVNANIFDPSAAGVGVHAITYTYTNAAGCSNTCTYAITVNAVPTVNAVSNKNVCVGSNVAVNFSGSLSGTTYAWTNSNPAIGIPANGVGNITAFATTNTSNTAITSTITVTPSRIEHGITCTGSSISFTISVSPQPTASVAGSDQNICLATTSTVLSANAPVAGIGTWSVVSGPNNDPAQFSNVNNPGAAFTPAGGVGTYTLRWTISSSPCLSSFTDVKVIVQAPPAVAITARYCDVPGKVRLMANPSYPSLQWSLNGVAIPGANSQTIDVDVAGIYTVDVVDAFGCSGTSSTPVSQDLVVNGNFTSGNTGFTSGYTYHANIAGNTELLADNGTNGYSVTTNGQNVHPNFWGPDHTKNATGARNFMIVNGHGTIIVWSEMVTVKPNTNYYFSAWAMSLNKLGPFAQLQFNINGGLLGTTAVLDTGLENNSNAGWQRFYGVWNSGSVAGPITISIVDLQNSLVGNDFGIDDISFGTLDPFPITVSPTVNGLSSGVSCEGQVANLAANITGGKAPVVYNWTLVSGPNVPTITDPNAANSTITGIIQGTYVFKITVSDGYNCPPVSGTTSLTVNEPIGISGNALVCPGSTTQYTGTGVHASPVAFTSSDPTIATVDPVTGLVTGVAPGTISITYENSTGCVISKTLTVDAPTITGNLVVCANSTTQLTGSPSAQSPLAWTSQTPSIVTVDNSGLVRGVATGTGIITYTNSNGCSASVSVKVNPNPVTAGVTICQGGAGVITSSTNCPSETATSAGPNLVKTVTSTGAGSAWNNLSTGTTTVGGAVSTTALIAAGNYSQLMTASNFGFNIPANSKIVGIQVTLGRVAALANTIRDSAVQLTSAGALVGAPKVVGGNWPTVITAANYGAANNLWGATLTPAQVNASNFGVAVVVKNASTTLSGTASLDYVQMTITYTVNGMINWYSAGGILLGSGSPFSPVPSALSSTDLPGTYTFYAECSTIPGCRTATNFIINATPTVSAGIDQSVCSNSPAARLAGVIGGGATTATWSGGSGSFNPNRSTLNALYTPTAAEINAGSVTLTLTTNDPVGPCTPANDAIVIKINAATTSSFSASACNTYTLPWTSTPVTTSGDYTHTYSTVNGCDSVVTGHITINKSVATSFSDKGCNSYTLPWSTTAVTASGDYTHTYTTAKGCDSIVKAHITINTSKSSAFTDKGCNSYTLPWTTTPVTATGDYTHTYTTAAGCDSIVTAHITINTSLTSSFTDKGCNSYTLPWSTTPVTTSGDYTHIYTSVSGCDSVVTAHIAINTSLTSSFTDKGCNSYTLPWSTAPVTTSGDYTHTYTSVSGCDSIVTAHITINSSLTSEFTDKGCNSYTLPWSTTSVTTSGDYTHTYTSVTGCDSIVTAHITINSSLTSSFTDKGCNSYTLPWSATPVTVSGDYTHTYTSVSGCDSVVTAHIAINTSLTSSFTDKGCNSYTLPWSTAPATTSGDYTHTYTSVTGCDSVVTAHITINTSLTSSFTDKGCNSYTLPWSTTPVTTSGDYTHTYTSVTGCDSIVTAHITINTSLTSSFTDKGCNSYTLPWSTTPVTISGDYTHTYASVAGCDSVVTAHITINTSLTSSFTDKGCNSYTLPWSATPVTIGGDYTHTYTSVTGCDSVVTAHITINTSLTSEFTDKGCNSYTLPWSTTAVTSSGDYTHTYASVTGCDSVVTAHITINTSLASEFTDKGCNSYTLPWSTTPVTTSGDYTHTYTSVTGCDSVVTAHIAINTSLTSSFTDKGCNSYTLPWSTTPVTTSRDYTHTYTSVSGCDSVVTAHITINTSLTSEFTDKGCNSYTLPWNVTPVTTSGDYTHTYASVTGCDSIVTAHIAINTSLTSEFTDKGCNSYTLPWSTTPVTTSGDYTHTYASVTGCDSVVTAHITINTSLTSEFTDKGCNSYTLPWSATPVTISGNYTHTYASVSGCDSVVTAHITINTSLSSEFTDKGCNSYTLPWSTTAVTSSGDYTHTYASVSGCDSVVTAHITINTLLTSSFTDKGCNSYTLPWDATPVTTSGDYTHTYTSVSGCDSVVTAHITINTSLTSEFTDKGCNSYTLPWSTTPVTTSGDYTHTYTSVSGCDSVVTAHITINTSLTSEFTDKGCNSYTLPWNTTPVTTSGDYTHTYTSVSGCDSVVTAHITINTSLTSEFTDKGCNSYTLPWDVTPVTASGDYTHTYASVTGCDSIVTAHITINTSLTSEFIDKGCNSYTLPWSTTPVTTSGDYTHTYASVSGCDSVVTAHITINTSLSSEFTDKGCNLYTLPWSTTPVTTSGDYTHTYTSVSACDSTVTAHITINTSVTSEFTDKGCNSYTLPWSTTPVTTSGDYTHTYTSVAGCDSVVTAHITINTSLSSEFTDKGCNFYTLPWSATPVTTSGDYTHTYTSVTGCDSLVTAHITINTSLTSEFTDKGCNSYTLPWSTTPVTTSGDYTHTYTSFSGCDSVVTAHITINTSLTSEFTDKGCNSYTLPWSITPVTTSGDYTHTYTSVTGCDSVVTAHITINTSLLSEFTNKGCNSYTLPWSATPVTTSGDYTHTYTSFSGCDSVVTAHITINTSLSSEFTDKGCNSYTLPWSTTPVTTSGDFTHTYTSVAGCDSVVTAHITINTSLTSEFTAHGCGSYTLPWDVTPVTASSDYTHTYASVSGCDSVVTAHIAINTSLTSEFTDKGCNSYTLPWSTTPVTTSGDYTHTYTSVSGCDSLVTAHITINTSLSSEFTDKGCDSYTLPWSTTPVTTSGDYTHTYTSVTGCDSVVTAHITINTSLSSEFTDKGCNSYSLPWSTTPVTTSGDYTHTYTSVSGCDSTVTAHITINISLSSEFTDKGCDSYTLPWSTTPVTTSGDYTHTYTSVSGCDSVVTAHITINTSLSSEFTDKGCGSYTLPWDVTPVTASGDYTHTYGSVSGCDSVVTAHITINTSLSSEFTDKGCNSYTLPWSATPVTTSGDYTHTYTSVTGCDSVVTAHITINNSLSSEFTDKGCNSYTLPWSTTAVTISGDYTHTYASVTGCDSVVTAHITINTSLSSEFTAQGCNSYTLPWDVTPVTTSGDYTHTYASVSGCDSVVTAYITINTSLSSEFTDKGCNSYILPWSTTPVIISGDYTHTYASVTGCDSIVTAHITINTSLISSFTDKGCNSYTLPWDVTPVTTSGDYTHTYTSVSGCDSVVTAHITINTSLSSEFSDKGCNSYTLPWSATPVTTSGDYTHTYTSVTGCDSVVTAHITINTSLSSEFSDKGCNSYTLPWSTTAVTISGDYTHTYTSVSGCDSVVTAHITINTSLSSEFSDKGCNSYTLPWSTTAVTISGDYTHTYTSVSGCDSVVTAHITINTSLSSEFTDKGCNSYTLPWSTTAVTTSGDYTHTYASVTGCDSVVTAHITINTSLSSEFTAQGCGSYTLPWDVTPATTSGDYTHTYASVTGCDSVVTAHITINTSLTSEFTDKGCNSYTLPWDATPVTTSGDYTHTYASVTGCDSVVTAHITINTSLSSEFTDKGCNSYSLPWSTTPVTTSGDYTHTYMSVTGCDSVVTAHISINTSLSSEFSAQGCGSYTLPWDITPVTTSGDYIHTYASVSGCDSVVTAQITINTSLSSEFTAQGCGSYTLPWDVTPVTTSGDYTHTYTSVTGCDSVVTAHITINTSLSSEFSGQGCGSYTLPWDVTPVTTSGDYTHTYISVAGCDSVVTAHITINTSLSSEFTDKGCNSYTLPWSTTPVTTSGDYTHTYASVTGCDSVVTAHITINTSLSSEFTAQGCGSYTLPWDVTPVATSGDYTHTYASVTGCDSVVTAHITINTSLSSEFTAQGCGSYTLPWDVTPVTTSGDYTHTYASVTGCDSVVTAHITINTSLSSEFTAQGCGTYTLPWDVTPVTASGDYIHTYASVSGCDSVVTAHITINNSLSSEFTAQGCGSYTLPWDVTLVTTSGDYTHTYASVTGCDSVVTAHITINTSLSSEFTAQGCGSYTLPWDVTPVTTSGGYTHTYTSVSGCDSVVTAHITINTSLSSEFTDKGCNSYTLPWSTTPVTTSGDYTHTYTSVSGCDSVVTAHITINTSLSSEFTAQGCNSYTLPWDITPVTTSGDYIHTYASVSGCDSVVTAHITINTSLSSEFTAQGCGNYTLPWDVTPVTTSGDYTHTYASVTGCDSVVTAHITINTSLTSEFTDKGCNSYTLPWSTTPVTTSGDYSHNYASVTGCDSVVTAHITINTSLSSEFTAQGCGSYTLPWDVTPVTTSGDYTHTYASVTGCDSVVTAHITINTSLSSEFTAQGCGSYTLPWDVTPVTTSGDYTHTYASVAGCDSVVTAHITINTSLSSEFTAQGCGSYTLPWDVTPVTTSGDYTHTYASVTGCDSVVTAQITINTSLSSEFTAQGCGSYTLPWDVTPVTTSGDYTHTYASVTGCDSVVTAHITINTSLSSEFTAQGCGSYTLSWDVTPVTTSGDYTHTYASVTGCDSVVTAHITINTSLSSEFTDKGCNSYTLPWDVTPVTTSGDYTHTYASVTGCDSVVIAHITINTSLSSEFTAQSCGSYTLPWDVTPVTTSGDYTHTYASVTGCDSVVTAHITINTSLSSEFTAQGCGSYTLPWNVTPVTTSGDYTHTYASVTGCDSVVTAHITVNKAAITEFSAEACDSYQLPWSATPVTTSGDYVHIYQTTTGCDSTVTVHVTIHNVNLVLNDPSAVCAPGIVDLTIPSITTGSDAGLTYSYWINSDATNILNNANAVAISGTYYIKAVSANGCNVIKPVIVTINVGPAPNLFVNNPAPVCAPETVDLTAPGITAGSDAGLHYTYWTDAGNTVPIDHPESINASGTYYITATGTSGCSAIKSVMAVVKINKGMQSMRYPTVTTRPNTPVQLSARELNGNYNYSWHPPVGLNFNDVRSPVFNYNRETEYTITITPMDGSCPVTDTVLVAISETTPLPKSAISVPNAWSPNGDGHNDKLFPLTINIKDLKYFRVYNRWGQLVFESHQLGQGWDGTFNGAAQVMDAYTWVLEADGEDGIHYKLAGNSLLMR